MAALVVAAAALVVAAPAVAARKTFWYGPYDKIGQDVSGVSDLRVEMEDDWADWGEIEAALGVPDGESLLGFAAPAAQSPLLYHQIFLSPQVTLALTGTLPLTATGEGESPIWERIASGTLSYQDAAVAILTLIHEAYHYRLNSGDEARVNACALRDMPTYLATEFHIPQTLTTTVQVPETRTVTKRVPYYVTVVTHARVRGRVVAVRKKVLRYRTVTAPETVTVSQQQAAPNPQFDGIMAAAVAFRAAQPAPYNGGDCF